MSGKEALKAAVLAALEKDLEAVRASALAAHEGATHEDSKAENQYDTRGLEQSYLAGAQAARVATLEAALERMRGLAIRTFDKIAIGARVELLDEDGATEHYFLSPEGGGLKLEIDGRLVRVLTPQSPLGRRLIGKTVGDGVELRTKSGTRDYEVVSVS